MWYALDDKASFVNQVQARAESEKTLLARRIHDELGGYLLAATMDLSTLRQKLLFPDDASLRRLDRIARLLHSAIDMARSVTEELHPTLLDNVGLFAALRREMHSMCVRSRIHCTEHFPETEPRLSPSAGIALFRIGQEGLIIAESHPGVTAIDFHITIDRDTLRMQISTDPAQAAPPANTPAAEAWASVQVRTQALGGQIQMEPKDGGLEFVVAVSLENTQRGPVGTVGTA